MLKSLVLLYNVRLHLICLDFSIDEDQVNCMQMRNKHLDQQEDPLPIAAVTSDGKVVVLVSICISRVILFLREGRTYAGILVSGDDSSCSSNLYVVLLFMSIVS